MPNNEPHRRWWNEAWTMGLDNPTDRTFVVIDRERDDEVVAFSRWQVPQENGSLERRWPDLNSRDWDLEVANDFFNGMDTNRKEMMQKRPHWCMSRR